MSAHSEVMRIRPPLAKLIDLVYPPDHQVAWSELWLTMAHLVAKRSRCSGDQVGAVLVSDENVMLAVGYNGAPRDFWQDNGRTCESWCPRAACRAQGEDVADGYVDCPSTHAEISALLRAPEHHGETFLYVSRMPCFTCAKVIGAAIATKHISAVTVSPHGMTDRNQDHTASREFLESCGIAVRVW